MQELLPALGWFLALLLFTLIGGLLFKSLAGILSDKDSANDRTQGYDLWWRGGDGGGF